MGALGCVWAKESFSCGSRPVVMEAEGCLTDLECIVRIGFESAYPSHTQF